MLLFDNFHNLTIAHIYGFGFNSRCAIIIFQDVDFYILAVTFSLNSIFIAFANKFAIVIFHNVMKRYRVFVGAILANPNVFNLFRASFEAFSFCVHNVFFRKKLTIYLLIDHGT